MQKRVSDKLLLATVFVTGACVLVIELMGTRLLAPFFGSGIYTWSALIAVTLAALALGYMVGGGLADKRHQLSQVFTLCFLAGIWTLLIPVLSRNLVPVLAGIEDIRLAVLLSSLILFGPNLFLLGAVGPYVIRLVTSSGEVVGSSSGLVFSLSTVGSLVGAIGAGFFLVPNYGVSTIFTVCGFLLLSLSAIGLLMDKTKLFMLPLLAMTIGLLNGNSSPIEKAKLLADVPSFYGRIQVIEKGNIRSMLVDGIGQNYLHSNNLFTVPYINFISAIIVARERVQNEPGRLLLIGVGAGHLPRLMQKNHTAIDVVELDEKVIGLARKYFEFDLPSSRIFIGDGRMFLQRSEQLYRYIVIDAFSADQVAYHLLSMEALRVAKSRLRPGGQLIVNLTSTIGGKDVAALHTTLKTVFKKVNVYSPEPAEDSLASIVFIASEDVLEIKMPINQLNLRQLADTNAFIDGELLQIAEASPLTDDHNPLTHFRAHSHVLWRSAMRSYLGEEDYFRIAK